MLHGLKLALALIIGYVSGSVVKMGILFGGAVLSPSPLWVDMRTAEDVAAMILLGLPKLFLARLLGDALGTLVGVIIAGVLAVSHRAVLAYALGGFFLLGGVPLILLFPSPSWFVALDLVAAYIPMAWVGLRIADTLKPRGS